MKSLWFHRSLLISVIVAIVDYSW